MGADTLVEQYPRLFHLAEAGSWPSIARHGLLPAAHIVTTSKLSATAKAKILEHPRPRTLRVEHPVLGQALLRDQTPLRRHILEQVLLDMSVREWLAILNDRVFFWLHPRRLDQLLNARRNRGRPHDVLVIDTASLIAVHHDSVRLSPINSGATLYPGAPQRGKDTFLTIEDYPYIERRRERTPHTAIAELAVIGGVPDIANHVLTVQRRLGSEIIADGYVDDTTSQTTSSLGAPGRIPAK